MTFTYYRITLALSVGLLGACAARRPPYVVVPRAASRSEEPVPLPLDAAGRARLEAFLARGGHPAAPDPVPDPRAEEHRRALDALARPDALPVVTTNATARRFCDEAAALCRDTALFNGQPFVRQVVDARESRRPVPAPLAVRDGAYWWIFRLRAGRLDGVLLVCDVNRDPER
jgi:hypothetical protein